MRYMHPRHGGTATAPRTPGQTLARALAALLLLTLGGCMGESSDKEVPRLYAVNASEGQFKPTQEAGVYTLQTRRIADRVDWFRDTPRREVGSETLDNFMQVIWPRDFAPYPSAASIGVRSADGVWSVLPAEVLAADYQPQSAEVNWRLRLHGTPDTAPQSGVVIHFDDVGSRTPGEENYVFLHAGARAQFVARQEPGSYELRIAYPLPEQIIIGATPAHVAALLRNDFFVDTLWPLGYGDTPPNAAVTIEAEDGSFDTRIVTLSDPYWDAAGDRLTYRARFIDRLPAPDTVGPAVIYIDSDEEDTTRYGSVINHEEQYSLWPADRELPLGWNWDGFFGTKPEVLKHIEVVWTDMRPLSLRKKMEEMCRTEGLSCR